MNTIDEDLGNRALEEVKANEETIRIPIEFSVLQLMSVVGALQLALRHPAYKGPSSHYVKLFIEEAKQKFEGMPAIQEVIERGNDPAFDYEVGNEK